MSLPSPDELATLLAGAWQGPAPQAPFRGVSIDSRRVRSGDLFFALPGRHRDGHDFLAAEIGRAHV